MRKASRSTRHSESSNEVPRLGKRQTARDDLSASNLAIRTTGAEVAELRDRVRTHLNDQLASFAAQIARTGVRFEDGNDARGSVNSVCRIKAELPGFPTVQSEASSDDPEAAFKRATAGLVRQLRKTLGHPNSRHRAGRARGATTTTKTNLVAKDSSNTRTRQIKRKPLPQPEDGSLIGRRVGHAGENIARAAERPEKVKRNSVVDTALPGWSETDRRAGGASTAARNTKRNTQGMTSMLEDSAKNRPSRKSTRRSTNRAKRDANLRIRQMNRVHSPPARASR